MLNISISSVACRTPCMCSIVHTLFSVRRLKPVSTRMRLSPVRLLLRFVNGSKNSKTFVPDLSCCVPRTFPLFVSGAPRRSERSWELASCVVHVQTVINRKKKFIISSTLTQNMDRNLQTLWLLDEFRSFVVSVQQNKSNPMRLEEHAFSKL